MLLDQNPPTLEGETETVGAVDARGFRQKVLDALWGEAGARRQASRGDVCRWQVRG